MQINAYLVFDGQCKEAFTFYEQVLGGKLELQTHADSPMAEQTPPGWSDRILHARLVIDDQVLMGSDSPPEQHDTPKGFSVSVTVNDPSQADRIFQSLAANGSVQMPIQETFWASRFGMLTDRFGVPWMVNYDRPA
jgi:PhnB protein